MPSKHTIAFDGQGVTPQALIAKIVEILQAEEDRDLAHKCRHNPVLLRVGSKLIKLVITDYELKQVTGIYGLGHHLILRVEEEF